MNMELFALAGLIAFTLLLFRYFRSMIPVVVWSGAVTLPIVLGMEWRGMEVGPGTVIGLWMLLNLAGGIYRSTASRREESVAWTPGEEEPVPEFAVESPSDLQGPDLEVLSGRRERDSFSNSLGREGLFPAHPDQEGRGVVRLQSSRPGMPVILLHPGEEVTVGRGGAVTVRIDRPGLSARHLSLRRIGDDRIEVTDLGSEGGTFIDGERLEAHWPSLLKRGERLSLAGEVEYAIV